MPVLQIGAVGSSRREERKPTSPLGEGGAVAGEVARADGDPVAGGTIVAGKPGGRILDLA